MIHVAIVEDKDIIREGLVMLVEGVTDLHCVGEYRDCESMLKDIRRSDPDVLLMDIHLPGMSGIEGVKAVKQLMPELEIIMLTVVEDRDKIFEALCAGASGYMVKKTQPQHLLDAIRDTYHGGSPMNASIARKVVSFFHKTPLRNLSREQTETLEAVHLTGREQEVLSGLSVGKSYQVLADSLCVSTNTIRHHIRNIYRKLQVHSQSEAVAKALKNGLI